MLARAYFSGFFWPWNFSSADGSDFCEWNTVPEAYREVLCGFDLNGGVKKGKTDNRGKAPLQAVQHRY